MFDNCTIKTYFEKYYFSLCKNKLFLKYKSKDYEKNSFSGHRLYCYVV